MADERIDIQINDKVDSSIERKILRIAKSAERGHKAVNKLNAELKSISSSPLNRLNRETAKMSNSLAKAEAETLGLSSAQKKLSRSTKGVTLSMRGLIGTVTAFLGLGLSGRAVVGLADSFTNLQNKLRNVTNTAEQLNEVTQELFEISRRTRTPIEDTARAFSRFDLALKQLGASQQESLRLTETVNKALILSGSTTGEQRAALLQLSQAFNKGKLDGDEFRTVMELLPPVADAIAKQLGVARGELLNLAPEGKITSEVLREALANVSDDIDRRFGKTIATLSQSLVVFKNAAIRAFGEFEQSTGVVARLAQVVLTLADNFKVLLVGATALATVIAIALTPTIIAATKAVIGFTAALAANPIGLIAVGVSTAIAALTLFKDEIKLTSDGVVTLGDALRLTFQVIADSVEPVAKFFRQVWNIAFDETTERAAGFANTLAKGLRLVVSVAKLTANTKIAIWVGAYNTILNTWRLFPSALGDIVKSGVNLVIDVVQVKINAIVAGLKVVLNLANKAAKILGKDPIFGAEIGADLSKYKLKLSGAVGDIATITKDEFSKAFKTDFVGEAVKAIDISARIIANKRRQQGEGPKAPQLRGPEKAIEDTAASKLQKLTSGFGGKGQTFLQGTPELLQAQLAELESYYKEVDKMRQDDLISEQTAQALKTKIWLEQQNLVLNQAKGFFDQMAVLQGSNNAKLQKIGKAAAISGAIIDTYKAATGAYASLASIPYVGPALGAAAAGAAVAAGLANVAKIKSQPIQGYQSGGFTGNIATDQVAGVVHGREFVVNAAATARNRETLEAMNRGADVTTSNGNSHTMMNVTVENYGSSEISVERVSETDVRIIAREVAAKAIREEAPSVIAADINNPNSRVSKSLNQNTQTTRKR